MSAPCRAAVVTRERFDAVLFDLDGVLTDTARIHASSWKRTFDDFLERRARHDGVAMRPFDIDADYRQHVDGKPRLDGVRGFLRSRGIVLAEGSPTDAPGADTVCGLGNRKNELVKAAIAAGDVVAYPGSVALLRALRAQGTRCAVVTSSRNRVAVLDAVKLSGAFDAAVDGDTIVALGLAGKPSPEVYLQAARMLGVPPRRAVVIDDAISGVRAGADGGFGLVIGVARGGNAGELRRHGADLVVADLAELLEGS